MKYLCSIIFVILLSTLAYGQTFGKLYDKNVANSIYGEILNSENMEKTELLIYLNQVNNYIMFTIMDNKLVIIDKNRVPLLPKEINIDPSTVFYMFSVSKIHELMNAGGSNILSFEIREKVFTITNGNYTLEDPVRCPPFCN